MIKKIVTKLGLAGIYATTLTGSAFANTQIDNGANAAAPTDANKYLFNAPAGQTSLFTQIANTLIFIIGAIAVIMLIIGGLRYVISQGSKEGVTQAKDTILYSIIGIIVAVLAYAIVQFVGSAIK